MSSLPRFAGASQAELAFVSRAQAVGSGNIKKGRSAEGTDQSSRPNRFPLPLPGFGGKAPARPNCMLEFIGGIFKEYPLP